MPSAAAVRRRRRPRRPRLDEYSLLLGLMKTDVYDSPEDKADVLNDVLENDTGGINTYLQSLAPDEKYEDDAMLFSPMRQDLLREQSLNEMRQRAQQEFDKRNLGLGDMDG